MTIDADKVELKNPENVDMPDELNDIEDFEAKDEKELSRFIRVKFFGRFSFEWFNKLVLPWARGFIICSYQDNDNFGLAHVKFATEKQAKLFKRLIRNMRTDKKECKVQFDAKNWRTTSL